MYTPSGQMFMRRIIVGVSLFKKWTTTTDTNCGFVAPSSSSVEIVGVVGGVGVTASICVTRFAFSLRAAAASCWLTMADRCEDDAVRIRLFR